MLGDHVTLEQGTGAVHTAPGHGQEDYVVGMQYGLSVYCPVDPAGRFFKAEGAAGEIPAQLLGKTVWEGNPIVIDILKPTARCSRMEPHRTLLSALLALPQRHHLPRHRTVVHRHGQQQSAPARPRRHRGRQMDARMGPRPHLEHGEFASRLVHLAPARLGRPHRRLLLRTLAANRSPITTSWTRVVRSVRPALGRHLVRREAADLIPPGTVCAKCGIDDRSPKRTTFSMSGSIPAPATSPCSMAEYGLRWPADMYMEGGDQYRGWFQSSLLIGVGLRGGAPYRVAATHGWALDGEGRAMHKSLGNTIEPEEIIKDSGAELIRLWSASVDFTEDVRISPIILTRLVRSLSKAPQHLPLSAGQPSRFRSRRKTRVPGGDLREIDQWVLVRAEELVARCRDMVRRIRLPQGLSRGLRFRHHRPQLYLLRCAQRPALYQCRTLRRAGAPRPRYIVSPPRSSNSSPPS